MGGPESSPHKGPVGLPKFSVKGLEIPILLPYREQFFRDLLDVSFSKNAIVRPVPSSHYYASPLQISQSIWMDPNAFSGLRYSDIHHPNLLSTLWNKVKHAFKRKDSSTKIAVDILGYMKAKKLGGK
jgi:hypothetical protein